MANFIIVEHKIKEQGFKVKFDLFKTIILRLLFQDYYFRIIISRLINQDNGGK